MKNKDAFILAAAVALSDSAVKGFIKDPPVKNFGFAGNKMDRHPKTVAYVSAVLTGVMAAALAVAPERMKGAMALILGGALSNSADRLIRGYVVDYIPMCLNPLHRDVTQTDKEVPIKKRYYCNISDIAIFLGSGIGAGLEIADGMKIQQ